MGQGVEGYGLGIAQSQGKADAMYSTPQSTRSHDVKPGNSSNSIRIDRKPHVCLTQSSIRG